MKPQVDKTYTKLMIERKSTESSLTVNLQGGLTLAQAKDYVAFHYPGWVLVFVNI